MTNETQCLPSQSSQFNGDDGYCINIQKPDEHYRRGSRGLSRCREETIHSTIQHTIIGSPQEALILKFTENVYLALLGMFYIRVNT